MKIIACAFMACCRLMPLAARAAMTMYGFVLPGESFRS